jgi:hypothetical protein
MTALSIDALFARQRAARWRVAATSAQQRRAKLEALLVPSWPTGPRPRRPWPPISSWM